MLKQLNTTSVAAMLMVGLLIGTTGCMVGEDGEVDQEGELGLEDEEDTGSVEQASSKVNGTWTFVHGVNSAPDVLFSSHSNYSGVRAKRGSSFSCTVFQDSAWRFSRGPIASYVGSQYKLFGSNQVFSGWSVKVSETSANDYVVGQQSGCTF